jgi:hypothetical protein
MDQTFANDPTRPKKRSWNESNNNELNGKIIRLPTPATSCLDDIPQQCCHHSHPSTAFNESGLSTKPLPHRQQHAHHISIMDLFKTNHKKQQNNPMLATSQIERDYNPIRNHHFFRRNESSILDLMNHPSPLTKTSIANDISLEPYSVFGDTSINQPNASLNTSSLLSMESILYDNRLGDTSMKVGTTGMCHKRYDSSNLTFPKPILTLRSNIDFQEDDDDQRTFGILLQLTESYPHLHECPWIRFDPS